jgi:hypothetical protein
MTAPVRYIAQHTGNNKYDVIHLGPYTVSKGLRLEEALALAKALNEENKDR